jgi:hypothetical protein
MTNFLFSAIQAQSKAEFDSTLLSPQSSLNGRTYRIAKKQQDHFATDDITKSKKGKYLPENRRIWQDRL